MIFEPVVDKVLRYGVGGVLFVHKKVDCLGCIKFVEGRIYCVGFVVIYSPHYDTTARGPCSSPENQLENPDRYPCFALCMEL